jgi:hypothetical protein
MWREGEKIVFGGGGGSDQYKDSWIQTSQFLCFFLSASVIYSSLPSSVRNYQNLLIIKLTYHFVPFSGLPLGKKRSPRARRWSSPQGRPRSTRGSRKRKRMVSILLTFILTTMNISKNSISYFYCVTISRDIFNVTLDISNRED